MTVHPSTRRSFLKGGALALFAVGSAPRFLLRSAFAQERAGRPRIVIAIFQRGAVDGLSMVVPHGDPDYYAARRGIAIARPARGQADTTVDLDGFFGLHPSLAALAPLWTDRRLAIVHACGSPDVTRSHFDAQDYMESGTPGVKSTADGWLARGLASTPARQPVSPFRAVAIGAALPRVLRGEVGAVVMSSVADFDVKEAPVAMGGSGARQGFESLYEQGVRDLLHGTGRETFEAVKMLERTRAAQIVPANGAEYGRSKFGQSMRQVAQLVRADVGLEVAFVDIGGWDTHVAQGAEQGQLANRLRELADGLAAFAQDLGDRLSDVVVLTMSEFGRTVAENGNRGTDHGHGNAMMIVGGNVKGGRVYGKWPGLAREQRYDGRDLAVTTDFRTVFAEVAGSHLGLADTAHVFPGFGGPLKVGAI